MKFLSSQLVFNYFKQNLAHMLILAETKCYYMVNLTSKYLRSYNPLKVKKKKVVFLPGASVLNLSELILQSFKMPVLIILW